LVARPPAGPPPATGAAATADPNRFSEPDYRRTLGELAAAVIDAISLVCLGRHRRRGPRGAFAFRLARNVGRGGICACARERLSEVPKPAWVRKKVHGALGAGPPVFFEHRALLCPFSCQKHVRLLVLARLCWLKALAGYRTDRT
jgi:hypothetical protein